MADTKTVLTWLLKDDVSGPAAKMKGKLGEVEAQAGKSTGIMGKLGGSISGMLNPTTLAIGAGAALVGFLGEAAKAAADEQINVQKMNTALQASVPNWKGNTDSIEALITKRENLGFSDDDLRNSMATLVTSTHDVKAAQDLQATAMDLARLKGIDLQTATEALAKANVGSTKELKALGITVDDTKDKTQVFAAIQKAAAGQAGAYAETSAGKWATMGIKFQDVMENIGAAILPVIDIVLNFAIGVIDAIGKVVGAISTLIGWIKDAVSWFTSLFDSNTKASKQVQGGGVGKFGKMPGRASGGPVDAGGAYLVGESGPEMLIMGNRGGTVVPNGGMGGGVPGVMLQGVTEQQILDMVDRGLYFRLQRSAPTLGRA